MSFQNRQASRTASRKLRSRKASSKRKSRSFLLEQLEARHLLAITTPEFPSNDTDDLWISSIHNFLPASVSKNLQGQGFLTGPQQGDKVALAVSYLQQNAASFGVTPNDINHNIVTNKYVTQKTGVTHVYLQQTFNDLPIDGAVANVAVMPDGRILTASSSFITGLSYTAPTKIQPAYEATQAFQDFVTAAPFPDFGNVQSVTIDATRPDRSTTFTVGTNDQNTVYAKLHYVPKAGGGLDLAWQLMNIRTADTEHGFDMSVALGGARDGQVIRLVDWVAEASYNVFPIPAESPLQTPQTFVLDPQDPIYSPFGWHDIDGIPGADVLDTSGNNVIAQEDINGNNGTGARPTGGPGLTFDYPVLDTDPFATTYTAGSTVNAFYTANILHDVMAHYGFDEAAGNFQFLNYSTIGLGLDPLFLDVQDGSGFNNANMLTPPDGIAPRMQQYIFINPGATVERDSSLDNGVVIHEFTHGISNRLTGGPLNASALFALQSQAMGEGWGDWLAMTMTMKPGDFAGMARPMGNYVLLQPPDGPGIRHFPYSFDMTINPLTLGDYNGGFPANEAHQAGEIWAQVLWDVTWMLTNKHGFDPNLYSGTGGNNLAMQLVLDGMKLQPVNPTFLQARDAIISADLALTGGENYVEIWHAFARRGFGIHAQAGKDADSQVVLENFEEPPPPTRLQGLVWGDTDNDGVRDSFENGIPGVTVYVDRNLNNRFDAGEPSTVSTADGTYSILVFSAGTATVRQVVPTGWQQTFPRDNAGYTVQTSGGVVGNLNFGDRGIPGEIHGFKFRDLNGDGVRDPGEPGVQGILIFVDANNDGKIGIGEMGAYTDANGNYTIKDVPPGIYTVREALAPGFLATFPVGDPANGIPAGVQFGVVVRNGQWTTNIDFGNVAALDWGDAPESYGTSAASNGPSHGILGTFRLGSFVDPEGNGTPSIGADFDDLNPTPASDDDGIQMRTPLTPGITAKLVATAQTGGLTAGFLQGWIDFNNNGAFDADEQIIKDKRLFNNTPTEIEFKVPDEAVLGPSYARFRYSHERGIGPTGPAQTGEVEDYLFQVLNDVPVAIDDTFSVKEDAENTVFDVTANDVGSAPDNGARPTIDTFQATTDEGGTVTLDVATNTLVYTPKSGFIGTDTFTYSVRDSLGKKSLMDATVTVNVLPGDPHPLSDTFRIAMNSSAVPLDVLWNDIGGPTMKIDPAQLVQPVYPNGETGGIVTVDTINNRILFTPPQNFFGTVQFKYGVKDDDPTTDDDRFDANGITVTVQVVPANPSNAYVAQFTVVLVDKNGNELGPGDEIQLGDQFNVLVYTTDLRTGPGPHGVQAAYLDLVYNRRFAAPVLDNQDVDGNPTEYDVQFEPNTYGDPNAGFGWNAVLQNPPGLIDELGAATDPTFSLGDGRKLLVTIPMTATTATNEFRIQADPADAGQAQVATAGGPFTEPVPFTKILYVASPTVRIVGPEGEGEFSNLANPLDVNDDGEVSAIDALIVINDVNVHGGREVTQFALASAGEMPPNYFIDVNGDGFVTAIDALWIINHLNTAAASAPPPSGEGEGPATGLVSFAAPTADPAATPATGASNASDESSSTLSLVGVLGPRPAAEGEGSDAEEVVPQSATPAGLNQVAVDALMGDADDVLTGGHSDDGEGGSDDWFGESDSDFEALFGAV